MASKMSKSLLSCLSLACALVLVGGCDDPSGGSANPSDAAGGGATYADLGITMLNLEGPVVETLGAAARRFEPIYQTRSMLINGIYGQSAWGTRSNSTSILHLFTPVSPSGKVFERFHGLVCRQMRGV